MKKIIITIIIIIIGYLLFINIENKKSQIPQTIEQNQEVVETPKIENNFVISYTPEDTKDFIKNVNITPGQIITSPLTITADTRGGFLFEATAEVILTNWDGLIIAESYIMTDGEWMTEDFVSVKGTLQFEKPNFDRRGYLIIKNSNPSDLPENDRAVEIPVFFE